jgi:hypothetical protein
VEEVFNFPSLIFKMEMLNKKGQTGGLVTGLIFGIAALVIGVIIAFVIVSTLNSAELIQNTANPLAANNETWNSNVGAYINTTGYTLAKKNTSTDSFVIVAAYNRTAGYVLIPSGNYTVSAAGVVTNATTTVWNNVSITYTYNQNSNVEDATVDLMTGNLTSGINNVSSKIPTVLLVAAIVLILGILAVLVGVWQKMRMGGGSI